MTWLARLARHTTAKYIDQKVRDRFVAKRLTPKWEVLQKFQQERRVKNTNLHKLLRMGYVGLVQKLEKELGRELTDLERSDLWTRARLDEEGQYMYDEVKEITK